MDCARSRWKGAQWAACNKRAMGAVSMDPFLRTMRLCPRSPMGLSAQILDEWFSEVACFRTAFYRDSPGVTFVHISRLAIDVDRPTTIVCDTFQDHCQRRSDGCLCLFVCRVHRQSGAIRTNPMVYEHTAFKKFESERCRVIKIMGKMTTRWQITCSS